MSTTLGKITASIGIGLLVYTGYQAMTCTSLVPLHLISTLCLPTSSIHISPPADRENVRLTQQEFQGLPLSLLWMLCIAVAVSMVGGLQSAGELKPISLADSPQYVVVFGDVDDDAKSSIPLHDDGTIHLCSCVMCAILLEIH